MKISLPLFSLLVLSTHLFSFNHQLIQKYAPHAQQWASDVVYSIESGDALCELLTLVHHSYLRSYMTHTVQHDYIAFVEKVGSGWNHILSTRLDPSKDADFDAPSFLPDEAAQEHLALFLNHCTSQKKYIDTVARLIEDGPKKFVKVKSFIDTLRSQARIIIAESLIEIMAQIEEELKKAKEALTQAADFFAQESHIKGGHRVIRPMTQLLWHYIPQYMVKAFVTFDRGYTASSKGCLMAYLESQKVSNMIWDAIEIPRAHYYAVHYQELFNALEKKYPTRCINFPQPNELLDQLSFVSPVSS